VSEADPVVGPRTRIVRLFPDHIPERPLGDIVLPEEKVMNSEVEPLTHDRTRNAAGGR
jgi:hypothetical protein